MSFNHHVPDWLGPRPTQADSRKLQFELSEHATSTLLRLPSFQHTKEEFDAMGSKHFSCRLFNPYEINRNEFGVTVGGTDLENKLEREGKEEGHVFKITMLYYKLMSDVLNDAVTCDKTTTLRIQPENAATIVNTFKPTTTREKLAALLVHTYIFGITDYEMSLEDMQTNTRPTWREGGDLAFIHYELNKLEQVYRQICEGSFIYHAKNKG